MICLDVLEGDFSTSSRCLHDFSACVAALLADTRQEQGRSLDGLPPSVFSGCRETSRLPLLLALEGYGRLALGFLGSSSLLISSPLKLGKCLGLKAYSS